MNGRKLNGVVTAVEQRGQTVETDAPESHLKVLHLHGINRIPGNPAVGTKVELEYRADYRSGLWWGRVVQPTLEQAQAQIRQDLKKRIVDRYGEDYYRRLTDG